MAGSTAGWVGCIGTAGDDGLKGRQGTKDLPMKSKEAVRGEGLKAWLDGSAHGGPYPYMLWLGPKLGMV